MNITICKLMHSYTVDILPPKDINIMPNLDVLSNSRDLPSINWLESLFMRSSAVSKDLSLKVDYPGCDSVPRLWHNSSIRSMHGGLVC